MSTGSGTTAPGTPHAADDSAPSSSRRRSGRLRTIHARQAELKAKEISFRCAAAPHAEVRVVSLGAAVEEPTEENRGMRADGILVPMGYTVVGTLFHEPLRAWVDDEGLHRVQWGDARDGRRVAATPAKGAANVKDAVACVAAELARRVRENVDPVLPQLPPRRPRAAEEWTRRRRRRTTKRPRVLQLRMHVARHAAHATRTERRSLTVQRVRSVVRAKRHHATRGGRAGQLGRRRGRRRRASCARDRARARREGGIDRRRRRGGR